MMVLGIAGSPRRGGNTDILLAEVLRGAASRGATVKTIVLSDLHIDPCLHCDACLKAGQCRIDDDMQQVYRDLREADRIVLAAPIHFLGVPAQTKAMIDRFQAFWALKYVLKLPPLGDKRERKGLFVSVGGRSEPNVFEPAIAMVKLVFRTLDVAYAGELLFPGIDEKGVVSKNADALEQAYLAGQRLAE